MTTSCSLRMLAACLMLGAGLEGAESAAAGPPARSGATAQVSIRNAPGYVPLHDADSLAEKLGRRPSAPLVAMPFRGGARTLDGLGRAVCGALHTQSPDSLMRLNLTQDEFRVILWPEFPQSRPVTGLRWDDAWPVLQGRLNGGSVAAARDLGGHVYTLVRVEQGRIVPYRNFTLHNDIVLVVRDDEGGMQRFTFVRSIAERRGRFKIYSLRD